MITIHQSWNQKHINICFQAVAIHLQKRKKNLFYICVQPKLEYFVISLSQLCQSKTDNGNSIFHTVYKKHNIQAISIIPQSVNSHMYVSINCN